MATKKISPLSPVASLAEASAVLAEVGRLERQIAELNNELEAAVAEIHKKTNRLAGPRSQKREEFVKVLQDYVTKNRKAILTNGKKSLVVPGGEFGWRLPPTKVSYGRGGAKQAVANLQSLKLTQYLRVVVQVDREALLRDRPEVPGVRYSQKEAFYVKPESSKAPEIFPGVPTKK